MQQWLTEDAVELQLEDRFRPVRHRSTFQARTSKVWFELDTLVVSPALLPRLNSIRQFDSAVTDHKRKVVFHSLGLRSLSRTPSDETPSSRGHAGPSGPPPYEGPHKGG